MNRTFCTSGLPCRALLSFYPFLLLFLVLALLLRYLRSKLFLEEADRVILGYPMVLAYLGALAALPCDPVAWPDKHDIDVHAKNADVRVVFRAGDIDVLVNADRNVAKTVK